MNCLAQPQFLRSVAGSLILKVAAAATGLLVGILLARLLGPEEFGKYAIAMAAVSFLATTAVMGLPALVTRESAVCLAREDWSQLKALVVTSHRWVFLFSGSLVAAGAVLALLKLTPDFASPTFWWMSLCLIPLLAVNQLRASFLRGLGRVIRADIPDLLFRPVILVLSIAVIYAMSISVDSGRALVLQAGAAVLALILGSLLLVSALPDQARSASGMPQSHWLHGSWTFLAITLVTMLEGQLPLYMLGYRADAEAAGLYQAAVHIVNVVTLGLVAINLPLQPRLAALHANGDIRGTQVAVTEAARLGALLAIVATVIVVPLAGHVLGLFGEAYAEGANLLRLLVIAQLFNALSGSCGVALAMTGQQAAMLRGNVTALGCNALICWLTIPALGVMGAALGFTLGLAIWNTYFVYVAWKRLGLITIVH